MTPSGALLRSFCCAVLVVWCSAGAAFGQDRVTNGLQVLYAFNEGGGATVRDRSGQPTPLDLTIADPSAISWVPGGGLTFNTPTVLATTGSTNRLRTAIQSTGAVTIEAWVDSGDLSSLSAAPARIVAYSLNGYPNGGNFVLGQTLGSSTAYAVRLRTSSTNVYGSPDFLTPPGSAGSGLDHVVYTRNASGLQRLYLNGTEVSVGTRYGNLSNWNDTVLAVGNEPDQGRPWLGSVWLVAVYNRALDADDVDSNYAAGPIFRSLTIETPVWTRKPPAAQIVNRFIDATAPITESVAPTYRIPLIADTRLIDDNPYDEVVNSGSGSLGPAADGETVLHVNAGQGISYPEWDGARSASLNNPAWTLFVDLDILATVGDAPALVAKHGGMTNGYWHLGRVAGGPDVAFTWRANGDEHSVVFADGWPGTGRHQVVLTRNNGNYAYYVDGQPRGQAFDANAVPTGIGLHNVALGVQQHDDASTNRLEARYYNVWFNVYRAIGAGDVASLADNPWQIYLDQKLPAATAGQAYAGWTFAAINGSAPYQWSLASGALPPGLSLSPSGVLGGTPTQSAATPYEFAIEVTDGDGETGVQDFTLQVDEAPLTLGIDYPPGVCNLGDFFWWDGLSASGGQPPYTYELVGGWLTWPLQLDAATGVISGVPGAVETSYFTIRVTDAATNTATLQSQITVSQDSDCGSCHSP